MEAWHFQVPAHFSLLPDTTASSELGEIISLKVMVALGAFNVLVCDQSSNIVDIKIQGSESNLLAPRETLLACACVRVRFKVLPHPAGLHGSLLVQGPQTYISARLKDFAVLNVDPASIHKKVAPNPASGISSVKLSAA